MLSDEMLLDSYHKAIELNLERDFIALLLAKSISANWVPTYLPFFTRILHCRDCYRFPDKSHSETGHGVLV